MKPEEIRTASSFSVCSTGRRMNKQMKRKSSSKSFRFHHSIYTVELLEKPLPVAVFPRVNT
jgi:hypothetical protein